MAGIGIDIVELRRVRAIEYLERAAEYFLTPEEMKEFHKRSDKVEFFTSRFAVKEAVIKAFPAPISPLEFKISKTGVKPTVAFSNPKHWRYHALISISHSLDYAAGFAVVFDSQRLPRGV